MMLWGINKRINNPKRIVPLIRKILNIRLLLMIKQGLSALLFLVFIGCTSNTRLPQGQYYSSRASNLNLNFPGQTNDHLEYDKYGSLTKKTYRKYLNKIKPDQNDKLIYYSHLVDVPEETPYTALGKIVGEVDTTKIKDQGFVNRRIKDQSYLYKGYVDRTRKFISSEYLMKVDSGYFYLFSYAPIRHLIHNEEDIIIAQDSLNRKHAALIG
ncbi:MAG: hypothetical protein COW65_09090, partial [Cytophagales bacterium CG18_big_fil_WC_8_21_14_2_50_42_9]